MIVSITFSGVCAIAPGIPDAPDGAGVYKTSGPLRVCMPYSSRRPNTQEGDSYIPTHIPYVISTAALLGMTSDGSITRSPDDSVDAKGHQPPSAEGVPIPAGATKVWIPVRERLQIQVDGNAAPGTIYYDPSIAASVPDMRKIWGDRAKFRKECDPLYPIAKGVDPEVLTQILVPTGTVSANFRGKPANAFFTYPKPKTGKPAQYKPLAPEVKIMFEAMSSVVIASQSLVDGDDLDHIVFSADQNQQVEIIIGNSDLVDLRLRMEGTVPEPRTGPDADFELYYSLLKDPDNPSADDDQLPVPSIGGGVGWIKNCNVAFVQG